MTLNIKTNEVIDSTHQIIVTINVSGEAQIALTDTVDFDSVLVGLSDSAWVEITNDGTDTQNHQHYKYHPRRFIS